MSAAQRPCSHAAHATCIDFRAAQTVAKHEKRRRSSGRVQHLVGLPIEA